MGKIKQKLVTRTAGELKENGVQFTEDFGKNKKILGKSMPSKKIRNQMAGHLVRTEKQKRLKEEALMKDVKKN